MQILHYYIGWCLLVTSAFLGACSGMKLAYNHTDFLLLRYADSYLDLNSKQKEFLRAGLRERLETHRDEELPHVVALLGSMRSATADGLNAGEIDELLARTEAIFETTVAKTIPVFTPVLADLSDEQIAHLEESLAEKNEETKEEYLQEDPGERLEAKVERVTQRVEHWTGNLTRNQERLVTGVVELWPDVAPDWFDYRLARQRQLLEILESGAPAEKIEAFLHAWWVARAGQTLQMKRKINQLREGIKTLLLALDVSMSEKQRAHVLQRLEDVSAQLATL
jgi:hypothetical protein